MLNIGWGEFLIIGIVALIVIGPKELPTVLRTVGQWMTKLRRMASDFQSQFQEAMREAEMADLKKEVDDLTAQAKGYADFDPIGEVSKEFDSAQRQIESTINDKPADASGTSAAATAATSAAPAASAETVPVAAEPAVAPSADTPSPAPPPPPAELEPVGPADDPAKPAAGGKPA
jgi:sec-independent protein translocase protein TatB